MFETAEVKKERKRIMEPEDGVTRHRKLLVSMFCRKNFLQSIALIKDAVWTYNLKQEDYQEIFDRYKVLEKEYENPKNEEEELDQTLIKMIIAELIEHGAKEQ
jgi:hypothetical protein